MEVPGLVDLQVNGYLGVDFSSEQLNEADCVRAARCMLERGCSAFLPTMITSPLELYTRNLPLIARVIRREEFVGRLLGIHLEGPFISAADGARGAHNADWIRQPDVSLLDKMIDWAGGLIKVLTIAADVEGAADLARHATSRGITVALGHHAASAAQLADLAEAGAKMLTHLGNGIPLTVPRHDNVIWSGLANDALHATLITDGHHLPTDVIKVMIRAKGPDKCVIVSDASPLAGMPPGDYQTLHNRARLEPSGYLHNPDTGYMVGSSATLIDCMNYLSSLRLVHPRNLLAMAWDNPLNLLNLRRDDLATTACLHFDEHRCLFQPPSASS